MRRYRRAQFGKGQYAELIQLASAKIAENESLVSTAGNESLVSADLQSLVEATAAKVGLMFNQRNVGASRRLNDFYAEVPMTLGFESTPGQFVMFLAELRALPRSVAVRSVQTTPIQPLQELPKGIDVTKNLRINMTIAVLWRTDKVKK